MATTRTIIDRKRKTGCMAAAAVCIACCPPLAGQAPFPPMTGSAIPTAAAIPSHYVGNCPGTIEFVGHITVAGAGTKVDYQWERSDGTKGPIRHLDTGKPAATVDSAGTTKTPPRTLPTVSDRWRIGKPGRNDRFSEQLHILPPFDIRSTPALVELECD